MRPLSPRPLALLPLLLLPPLLPPLLLAGCTGDGVAPESATTEPTVAWADDAGGEDTGGDDTGGDEPWDIQVDASCNLMATGDDCLLPFPSLQFTTPDAGSPTGLRLDLHLDQFHSPDGDLPVDPAIFNVADGASPVTPILVNLGRDVHPDLLSGWGEAEDTVQPGGPIAVMNAETGELVPLLTEMDQSNRQLSYDGRWSLIIRPQKALTMGARYLVVLSDELVDTEGDAFDSPDAFVALRDGIPTTSDEVEALRGRYEGLFATAEGAGWEREHLLLAWDFQVASEDHVLGPIRSARAQALAALEAGDLSWTIDSVQTDPNENVYKLVRGSFTPPNFLTDTNELVLDGAGGVEPQTGRPSYPFTLVIPPAAVDGGGLPLVLLGHGLFGTGDSMLRGGSAERYTQPLLAQQGAVGVATDWIGLSGGDLDLIIQEVLPDIGRIRIVTDRLVQSHVNAIVLVEALTLGLAEDPAIGWEGEGLLVDPDQVGYYGISLGGIQGTGQVAVSPRIARGVAAVPGGGWAHMIQRSTQFAPLEGIVDALYPDPLSQQVFIALLQGFFDFSDPANLGLLLDGDPTMPDAPDKVLILQEGIGDCQVPNIATELLARTIGADHLEEATDPVYGLEVVTGPTTRHVLTQIRVPEDLEAYFPPDQNTLPTVDNGVHNDAVLQDAAFHQVEVLLGTGEAIHPCDGPCDPM